MDRLWAWIIISVYGCLYNDYFGWNAWPGSDTEIICDGIFTLALLAVVLTGKD